MIIANSGNKYSKTRASFNTLPESFVLNDIEKCFSVNYDNAKVVVSRFVKEGLVERVAKGKYKKLTSLI